MISYCSSVSNHNIHKNPRKECKIVKNNKILIILDLLELISFLLNSHLIILFDFGSK